MSDVTQSILSHPYSVNNATLGQGANWATARWHIITQIVVKQSGLDLWADYQRDTLPARCKDQKQAARIGGEIATYIANRTKALVRYRLERW